MKTQSETSRCGPALLSDSRVMTLRSPRVVEYQGAFGGLPWLISRAGLLRDCGTTDCGLPPSAEDTAMPSTRGKKRSPPETQKRNVNPRVGETREVTIASGHQKGQKKTQKLQHTPGGANLAWANEPCTKCTG